MRREHKRNEHCDFSTSHAPVPVTVAGIESQAEAVMSISTLHDQKSVGIVLAADNPTLRELATGRVLNLIPPQRLLHSIKFGAWVTSIAQRVPDRQWTSLQNPFVHVTITIYGTVNMKGYSPGSC